MGHWVLNAQPPDERTRRYRDPESARGRRLASLLRYPNPHRPNFDNNGYTTVDETAQALRTTTQEILHAVRAIHSGHAPRYETTERNGITYVRAAYARGEHQGRG